MQYTYVVLPPAPSPSSSLILTCRNPLKYWLCYYLAPRKRLSTFYQLGLSMHFALSIYSCREFAFSGWEDSGKWLCSAKKLHSQ